MKFKNRQHKLFLGTAKSLQLCPTLWEPPGSSVHGILRAKTLDWVAMPSSRGSSRPRDRTHICFLYWQAGSLPWSHQGIHRTKIKRMISEVKVTQSCPTLVTPWTVAHKVPLSMGLSRQEYWSGLPFPSPGNPFYPRIKPAYFASPELAGGFFTTVSPGKPLGLVREQKLTVAIF